MTSRKLAWDLFLDVVAELEAAENDYEAVAIDLVEDLMNIAVYVFDKTVGSMSQMVHMAKVGH